MHHPAEQHSKLPLSVFVICKDEVERLPLMLDSVKHLTDDIVIVDSGSTDGTLGVARQYTDRVFHRDWSGFGPQKVFAENLCHHDWVLNLDADEVLLDTVQESIRKLFQSPEQERVAAYSLRIRYVSMFSQTGHPRLFSPTNITPRLYDRRRAGFKDSAVHDKVEIHDDGSTSVLDGDVAHLSLKSFGHMWQKIAEYSALQAQAWAEKGRKPGWLRLLFDPPWFFIKNYFIRRLCMVGFEGLIISISLSAGRALRIGLTRELLRKKKH